jgi:hypothetical protein
MKRYFELIGKLQVLELDIVDGSNAATASVEDLNKHFKSELREVDYKEYKRLEKLYTS